MARRVIRFASIAAILAAALTGCTVADRAKALYLYQHKLLAALTSTIIAIEHDNPAMANRLYDSEDELNTACQALWDAGNRRVDAREIEDDLKWQVFTTLASCTEKPTRSKPFCGRWIPVPPRSTWATRGIVRAANTKGS